MPVRVETPLMTYPGKRLVKDSVDQFLQTPDTGHGTKEVFIGRSGLVALSVVNMTYF